ncbi:MAG: hypothetical protein OMM_11144 [Candidatus Magnetoglobus multicellularis str. Araruama]|uniref:Uncharacterized protein n=1 Tax=Candidatus Magnetoglobus multicellularis str. Araruama TaxID=890399 RepID=A0A1V1NZ65_9BACT|nr:MAG: hypothetical protein OMM_11144 [Candidatus Magnetoglobus multicellularis str. Araruama]
MGEISKSLPGYQDIVDCSASMPFRIFFGVESPVEMNTYSEDQALQIKNYLKTPFEDNYYNGIKCLAAFSGKDIDYLSS